ncbi:MAG: nicotinate (nicotinamide) nucleotide adenylyltransferase [Bacteroidota bacterium]
MKYTGLFLGSFNPVHQGHLILAETFASLEDMKEVWLVVSPQNPFKSNEKLMDFETRVQWAQEAIKDNPKLRVSSIEKELSVPSYTIHTLEALTESYPERDFVLLLGEDQLAGFQGWHRYQEILSLVPLWVYPRHHTNSPHQHTNSPHQVEFPFRLLDAPKIEISSTYIRERIRSGLSVRYLLPETIWISCSRHPFWCG